MIVKQKIFLGRYGKICKLHKYTPPVTLSHVCKVKTEMTG